MNYIFYAKRDYTHTIMALLAKDNCNSRVNDIYRVLYMKTSELRGTTPPYILFAFFFFQFHP